MHVRTLNAHATHTRATQQQDHAAQRNCGATTLNTGSRPLTEGTRDVTCIWRIALATVFALGFGGSGGARPAMVDRAQQSQPGWHTVVVLRSKKATSLFGPERTACAALLRGNERPVSFILRAFVDPLLQRVDLSRGQVAEF